MSVFYVSIVTSFTFSLSPWPTPGEGGSEQLEAEPTLGEFPDLADQGQDESRDR
jgi:hypothetical protein